MYKNPQQVCTNGLRPKQQANSMYGISLQLLTSPNKGAFSNGLMISYYSEVQTGRHCKVQGGSNTARLETKRSNEISSKIALFSKIKQGAGHI